MAASQNQSIWNGEGYKAYQQAVDEEAKKRQNNPGYATAYTEEGLRNAIDQANQNGANITASPNSYSQYGRYVQDGSNGVLPGTGEQGWGFVEGTPRTVKEGDAGADEQFLSDEAYAYVQYCKQMYESTKDPAQKAYWHEEAEKTRAKAGYSGGADGSMYIRNGQLGTASGTAQNGYATQSGTAQQSGGNTMQGYLDAWQQAAINQQNGQIDYAVAKAVADLERALADAQIQYKEQAESVDRDARQAMDNSALYAEMRGDKGGIGQEQYNSIQNTQAQNHLAVQQAQTKLATDTQRQIADLRAQGEFQKADAALEITQTYLSQLISLEQWAAEYNLSVEQFNASLNQWQAEYNMAMQQLEIGQNQWQAEFDAAQNQWQKEYDLAVQQMQISQDQWQKEFDRQSKTGGAAESKAFSDVSAAAKKKGSVDLTNKYLGEMVEAGDISLAEADYIFRVICGYSYDSLPENKYIITGKPDLNTGAPAAQVAVVN